MTFHPSTNGIRAFTCFPNEPRRTWPSWPIACDLQLAVSSRRILSRPNVDIQSRATISITRSQTPSQPQQLLPPHPIRRCSHGHSAKWCHYKLLGCALAICYSCLQGGLMSFKFSWHWLATSTTITWLAAFVDSLVVLCCRGILKSVCIFSHPKTGV